MIQWTPNEHSKIFRISSSSQLKDLGLIEFLKFFLYEAVLVSYESIHSLHFEGQDEFVKLAVKNNLKIVIHESSKNISAMLSFAEKFGDIVYVCISVSNLDLSVENLKHKKISWISLTLGSKIEESKLRILLETTSIPIFFEMERRERRNGVAESLATLEVVHKLSSMGIGPRVIYSLGNLDERFEEIFGWQTPREAFNYNSKYRSELTEISIVIPAYNRAKYLISVLETLALQTFDLERVEVIVVDDGGTDGLWSLLRSWLSKSQPKFSMYYFYLTRKDREGEEFVNRAGVCRNFGATKAIGTQIIFLDSDILLPQEFLRIATAHGGGDSKYFQPVRSNLSKEQTDDLLHGGGFSWNSQKGSDIPISDLGSIVENAASYCWVMSRSTFIRVGGFRDCFSTYGWEDIDFSIRADQLGISIAYLPIDVLHLSTLDDSSEFSDVIFDRRIKLAAGAEIFFRNSLSEFSGQIFVDNLIRSTLIYRGLLAHGMKVCEDSYFDNIDLGNLLNMVLGKGDANEGKILEKSEFLAYETKALSYLARHCEFKFENVLMVSRRITLLPTLLLADEKLGVGVIRKILTEGAHRELDDLVNFQFIPGWRFKSGQEINHRIEDSTIDLRLTRGDKTTIDSTYLFRTLWCDDIQYLYNLETFELRFGTKIVLILEIEMDIILKDFLDRKSIFLSQRFSLGDLAIYVGEVI
jgi:glycosyltransferase involved in cell wall biosynthesis